MNYLAFKIMKKIIYLAAFLIVVSCQSEKYNDVGDIPFNAVLDDPNFEICNENLIKQYYIRRSRDTAPGFNGEKRALENEIFNKYSFPKKLNQNGYITVRFIINCHGQSGRFRMEEMDFEFNSKKFDTKLSLQILEIVKKLNKWSPRKRGEKMYDSYQYLTFKIESGQILKILP